MVSQPKDRLAVLTLRIQELSGRLETLENAQSGGAITTKPTTTEKKKNSNSNKKESIHSVKYTSAEKIPEELKKGEGKISFNLGFFFIN